MKVFLYYVFGISEIFIGTFNSCIERNIGLGLELSFVGQRGE